MTKATLSAGGGAFVLSEEIEGYYAFRNSWLNSVSSNKTNLIMMMVAGDSMAPTIQARDTVLIDTGRRQIREGEIYALRVSDTIMIKRLSYRPGDKIMVISDNRTEYDPYEADIKDVHVLGQVIFFSRILIAEHYKKGGIEPIMPDTAFQISTFTCNKRHIVAFITKAFSF